MSDNEYTKPDRRSLLEKGLMHEKSGEWKKALDYWSSCLEQIPNDLAFHLRKISVALKLHDPGQALISINNARNLNLDIDQSKVLKDLQARAEKLQISLLRIQGVEAYEAEDFELARKNFEDLALAVPDHPWAATRAIQAAGFSPLFEQRLEELLPEVRQRIFLTGCGRSGTWLLTAMLHCIPDIRKIEKETPLGAFLKMPNEAKIHLIKRSHDAYKHFDRVPPNVKILHLIRHPFDVLCSRHRQKERYISMERLEAEHSAYFSHLSSRKNTLVVKYEDLVLNPSTIQFDIEKFLEVKSRIPFSEFYLTANMPDNVIDAMHGLRPLDVTALHKWKARESDREYLRSQIKKSNGTLEKFASKWNYDISL